MKSVLADTYFSFSSVVFLNQELEGQYTSYWHPSIMLILLFCMKYPLGQKISSLERNSQQILFSYLFYATIILHMRNKLGKSETIILLVKINQNYHNNFYCCVYYRTWFCKGTIIKFVLQLILSITDWHSN